MNEFAEAGFTEVPSSQVRPPRVAEAAAAFEGVVRQIIPTGTGAGAGTLVLVEVLVGHFRDDIFTENGLIDPHRLDLVGRLGANWYARASGEALFEVARPHVGLGFGALPTAIRHSHILTGNDLAKLAGAAALPTAEALTAYAATPAHRQRVLEARAGCQHLPDVLHHHARQLLAQNQVDEAWLTLLAVA